MKKGLVFCLVLGMFSGVGAWAQCVEGDVNRFEHIADGMGTKFGRGLVNVLTGLGEIPRQFARTPKTEVGWARWPVAFSKGLIMSVVRTGVGVIETCLFFVPTRVENAYAGPLHYDYGPILYPAYVWGRDTASDYQLRPANPPCPGASCRAAAQK